MCNRMNRRSRTSHARSSILEWVGAPGKPVASRIVPVSVFVNGQYEDGGLYLAQPAPLTVETDTLYNLEQAGVPKGTFYVAGGEEVAGAWFGYGQWKPLTPPKPRKLAPSKTPPKVIADNDPDRPHMKNSSPGQSSPSQDDPDKPTLHRAPGAEGSGQSTSPSAGGPSGSGTSGGSTSASNDPDQPTLHRRSADSQSASGAGTAPEDPDRPHLRKRSAAEAASGDEDGSPVSSVNEADPDRPKLSHGKPGAAQVQLQATKLTGVPANLQHMAAISDVRSREEHPFAYAWPDPADASRMQAAVEQLAMRAALTGGVPPGDRIGPAPATAPAAKTATRASGPKSTLAHKTTLKPAPVVLSDEDFHAYELSYNAGATVVLTAKADRRPQQRRRHSGEICNHHRAAGFQR